MSEYILDLRKTVGHRPLLQVGASVIVVDSEGRILLQQRRDNGLWGYAGEVFCVNAFWPDLFPNKEANHIETC